MASALASRAEDLAGPDSIVACSVCGLPQRLVRPPREFSSFCARCRASLDRRPFRVGPTLAYASAALLLYIPANILPIMSFEYYGAVETNTIWSGVKSLFESGMWFVAGVVFIASMVVPLMKLCVLFGLALTARSRRWPRLKTQMHRFLKVVSTWAMLDIFLVAVLVSIVKLGQLATVRPGPGMLPFALVVIFTILATENFNPRVLWIHERPADRRS